MEGPLLKTWNQFAACDDSVSEKLYPRLANHLWQRSSKKLYQHKRAAKEIPDLITDVLVHHVWKKKHEEPTFLRSILLPSAYLMRILLADYKDLVKSAEMDRTKIREEGDRSTDFAEIKEPGWEVVHDDYIKNLPEVSQTIWRQYIEGVAVDDMEAFTESGKPATIYLKRQTISQIREYLRKLHEAYRNGDL